MPRVGISTEKWKDTTAMTGFKLMPVGHGLLLEIEETREGVEKKGDHEYVMFKCVHTDDEGETYVDWEYFQLSDERLGFLKGFLEKTGRCDLMSEDAEWDDIIGTQFTSDVRHTKKGDETYVNLVLSTIEAVSHDFFEIPTEGSEDDIDAELDGDVDLNERIRAEAEKNEEESKQTKKALKQAKSTDVADNSSRTVSKASPRRPRRAGVER